jgi:hypothetical protein
MTTGTFALDPTRSRWTQVFSALDATVSWPALEKLRMKQIRSLAFLAASLLVPPWISTATAQTPHPDVTLTLAQAERVAVDLRQGMTVDEVQKLLGKPRRTALKSDGYSPNAPSKGTLQWSYSWSSASAQGSIQGNLRVEFVSKAQEEWYVNSWEWVSY